jgi:hypothetical protein
MEALSAPTVTFTESKSNVAAGTRHPKLFESFKNDNTPDLLGQS